jgi:hypothetical protein
LGVGNHLLALLTTPVVAVLAGAAVWRRKLSGGALAGGVALWLTGASPYLVLIAVETWRSPEPGTVLHSALFGHAYADEVLNPLPSARMVAVSAAFTALSFPNLLLPLSVAGLALGRGLIGSAPYAVLTAGLLIHAAFVVRYPIADQHLFFLPTYLYLAIFGGVGMAALDARVKRHAGRALRGAAALLLVLTPVLYVPAPGIARRLHVLDDHRRHRPYRDDYRYLLWPWSVADTSAERMTREAMELAGESGLIIVEDSMVGFAVRYGAIVYAGGGPQVIVGPLEQIDPSWSSSADRDGRPIVLVPRDTQIEPSPPPEGHWERFGDLYRFAPTR